MSCKGFRSQRPSFLVILSSMLLASAAATAKGLQTPEPPRLALLVGISKYQQVTTRAWRPLNTRRDLVEMKRVLMTPRYGFRSEDILVLQDREATAAEIRKAFHEHLIDKARPGALIVFHFSGHGQQVPDQNGDELDGLDETLVPYDAVDQRASEGAKVNIRDDEIADWLRALQTKMRGPAGKVAGSINVILDSCFAGTATRGMLVERGRGWDENLDGQKPAPLAKEAGAWGKQDPRSLFDEEGEYMALSAAQSDQTAKEVGDMGLFTRALVGALERATDQTTYRELLDEASVEVLTSVRNQLPQLEGNPDQRLFSGTVLPTRTSLRVTGAAGDLLTIPIGQLQLVTVGSIYELHSAGGGPISAATRLGEAQVVRVEPLESDLRLLPGADFRGSGAALLAARAIEKAHQYGARPLRVLLSAAGQPSALTESIKKLPMVLVEGVTPLNHDLEVRITREQIELRRPEDSCPFQHFSARPEVEAADHLEQVFRAEWRWRQLVELRQANPSVQASLRLVPTAVTLSTENHIVAAKPHPEGASGQLALQEGDYFTLEFTNPSPGDVWITVLQLERNGSISVLFPLQSRAGDGLIRARDTRLVPSAYVFRIMPPLGPALFKVITTTEKVDLGRLAQSAYETSRRRSGPGDREPSRSTSRLLAGIGRPLHPLAQLLVDAAQGQRGTSAATPLGAWSVTDAVLLQEPRTRAVRAEPCQGVGVGQ